MLYNNNVIIEIHHRDVFYIYIMVTALPGGPEIYFISIYLVTALPGGSSMYSVVIVYSNEAHDWASYLQQVLEASHHFSEGSITLYLVDGCEENKDPAVFRCSKCILLLLSEALIEMQNECGVRQRLEALLHPCSKVVAFLCGVSQTERLSDSFSNWEFWVKLDSEDEPALYVSTILDVVNKGKKNAEFKNRCSC